MKVTIDSETDIVLAEFDQDGFEIVTSEEDVVFGPMQMFATSLGLCTFSVLAGYGQGIGADIEGLAIRLRWDYAKNPYRIEPIEMDITWPALPSSRLDAARRAAEHCTIHHTLAVPTEVRTRVSV